MVKIYKGVVVYQNIGNVVIPDAQVDDLKVNNIATINTLDVLDTLGLSNIKINSGTITKYPVNQFDIVNKKYVDDNEGAFDPTQHIILTGTPDSLTVKKKAYFNGEVDFDGDINIDTDKIKYDSSSGSLTFKPTAKIIFTNNNSNQEVGNIVNMATYPTTLKVSAYNTNTVNDKKLLLMSGSGYTLEAQDYNKGILIDNSGLEFKGNTTFDNDITAGTGTNQIKLDTVNGDISGKTLTLSEGIKSGTIKAGSGSNQITLDSATGGITGKILVLSGNLTSSGNLTINGTNNNVINGFSQFKSTVRVDNSLVTVLANDIEKGFTVSYDSKPFKIFPENHTGDDDGYRIFTQYTSMSLHLFAGAAHYSDTNAKGLRISNTNGVEVKGDTTFNNNISVSGNLTAGTGTNQITLNSSSGRISCKDAFLTDNINMTGNTGYKLTQNGTFNASFSQDPSNSLVNLKSSKFVNFHIFRGLGDTYDADNINKGLCISSTGIAFKGDTTFNNNVSLTTGTISTAPTNNNDIVNKLYVDTVATSGFDPSTTMTLTNSNSLITNGDITNKTLIKTIEGEGSFSSIETVEFIMNYISSQPAGFFYDPKHNKIMTIKISNNEANIYMYDLSTNSSSLVRITDGTYTFMTVKSFQGRYDYINDTITIMICGLTNEGSPRTNRYTFYDYDNNSFSEFVEVKYTYTSHVLVSPQCTGSYDSKYYYFYSTEEAGTIMGLILESNLKFYFLSTSICAENIKNVYSFDYVDNNRFILVSTDTKLYLYKHSATSTSPSFSLCDSYTFVNDSNSKFFINGENNKSCYIYSSKFIYRCEIINSSNGYTIDVDVYYDNSSSNNSYSSGIVNYDGSLYMLSKYTTDNTITIDQFMRCGIQLKLIASKTYSDMDKSSPNYCILVKNQLYFITYKGSGQMPFYLRKISKLNNSSIISSNQTSINGNIKFDEEINIDDYPKDINEVITYGKLLKILKTCFTGNTDLSNLFVNYNKYISSCK